MLSLRRGRISAVVDRRQGLVWLEVDGRPCVGYPDLTGPVALGDDVLVNTQALDLELGSGGFDVLYANLTRGLDLAPEPGAHVMKLPYTPLQYAVSHAEEVAFPDSPWTALVGTPVVCCSLASQLVPVCAGLGADLSVVYVQLVGAALPLPLSDAVHELRRSGLLELTISPGACFGGELEAVSLASALVLAADRGAQAIVCALGPGIVGTGSSLGHGAVALVEALALAAALGAAPILAARVSDLDPRERHRGLSHHTRALVRLAPGPVRVAWPAERAVPPELGPVEQVETDGWEEACRDLPLSHMGRGPQEDPEFFRTAFAAGRLARACVLRSASG